MLFCCAITKYVVALFCACLRYLAGLEGAWRLRGQQQAGREEGHDRCAPARGGWAAKGAANVSPVFILPSYLLDMLLSRC